MIDLAAFADRWGWGITILVGIAYLVAKERKGILSFLSSVFLGREHARQKANAFALDQQAKATELTFEEQERRDTIIVLKETLLLLREDKKQAQVENKELQGHLIEIIQTQARREAESTNALQGLARVVVLQTDRLTDLTGVIEKIVGAQN